LVGKANKKKKKKKIHAIEVWMSGICWMKKGNGKKLKISKKETEGKKEMSGCQRM
jgi:hypothetical protein